MRLAGQRENEMKSTGIKVICEECGKKFTTRSFLPTCPRCGGADVSVR
jgi:Zn finger protein HypA/HybF involved in hydrogenase expression